MKKIIILIACVILNIVLHAESYVESFSIASDNYVNNIQDAKIIRQINGGSVLIPEFDDSCPEEMKVPFSYACKIVEEYMKPCMPLRIAVSCKELSKSYRNALSQVKIRSNDDFGDDSHNLPLSAIKGIVLAEIEYEEYYSHFSHVQNISELCESPDLELVYNSSKIDDFSFSLDYPSPTQYDFVSVVIRDILAGFGLTHSFRYNSVNNGLDLPSQKMIPFEHVLYNHLGGDNNSNKLLENATKGELELFPAKVRTLKLHAPIKWDNSTSLKYFIPDEDSMVSQLLSLDFGRGTVIRSLFDNYSTYIFRDLLGWKPDVRVSAVGGGGGVSSEGSTSIVLPYNGSLQIPMNKEASRNYIKESQMQRDNMHIPDKTYSSGEYLQEVTDYMLQFHPFMPGSNSGNNYGTTISILKKDGTWDVVKYSGDILGNVVSCDMNDFEFHCDDTAYARTIDGHLRARVTMGYVDSYRKQKYVTKYFVIDYLPQKVGLKYKLGAAVSQTSVGRAISQPQELRLYFSDIEGVDKVVIERLRPGARVPSKTEVTDLKKGYYDTTIDRKTLFTIVSYNKNGSTRGDQQAIEPTTGTGSITFRMENDFVRIITDDELTQKFDYVVSRWDNAKSAVVTSGSTDEIVDISGLESGLYMLSVTEENRESPATFKFRK